MAPPTPQAQPTGELTDPPELADAFDLDAHVAWEASGPGAPADVETLSHQISELEQQVLGLHAELAARGRRPHRCAHNQPGADGSVEPLTASSLSVGIRSTLDSNFIESEYCWLHTPVE
ncbi:hypothetical protein [Streptomyces sp. NPDC094437]|uniref:hypothetical protein n=1 Tax=Streptomyces sp. NPDC094437 TaxID=3366060 RepID=UPI0037F440AB